MKSVFITGATGFVGAAFVRHFAKKNCPVMASGRGETPPALLDFAKYLRADISHPMSEVRADIVVHAAALASDSATPKALQSANLDGVRHVFEATRGSRVFVYISSSSVYDYCREVHTEDESVDYQELSPYGLSKRLAEEWLLKQDWRDRTLVVLRPRVVYGPGDRMLLPRLMKLVQRGRIHIPGDMRVQTSLTHVVNLCSAVEACLDFFEKQPGGTHIFNMADMEPGELRAVVGRLLSAIYEQELPFREMPLAPLKAVAQLLSLLNIKTNFTPFALAAVSKPNILDCEKIAYTIGFQPAVNFEIALPEVADWAQRVGLVDLREAKADLPWRT